MSNAMRNGKRALAGVAAGALGLALIPFVSTGAANAATTTATPGPVRAGTFGTIPSAVLSFTGTNVSAIGLDDTITFVLVNAPSLGAVVSIDDSTGTTADDTATLSQNDAVVGGADGLFGQVSATDDDSTIRLRVDTAGSYSGVFGNGDDTVSWAFTTAGAPASMTLAPASQSILIGGEADLVASLLDASGNLTQPFSADSVTLATDRGTLSPTGSVSGSSFYAGAVPITFSGAGSAGTATITATPAGTLPAGGVTTQTASVTEAGTISDDSITGMSLTGPSTGVWNGTAWPSAVAQIASGTTSVTVGFDDTTSNTTPSPVRFKIETNFGSVSSGGQTATTGAPAYIDVTPSAGKGSFDLALAGTAAAATNVITITQVNVTNTVKTNIKLTVTVVVPDITAGNVTVTPRGNSVAKLGDTVNVSVSVDDSLGDPVAGQVVTAYRGSVGLANLLSTGTTGADGSAALTVTNAASLAADGNEDYVFTVSGISSSVALSAPNTLNVTYTASGGVTTLAVTPQAASVFDAAGATVTTISAITVPDVNSSGLIGTTMSTGTYNPTTEASAGTATAVVDFRATTTPANSYTVTVPEGVKVSATAPTATTLWSDGSQTATASADDSVWIWATKTGTHAITVESGGLTATGSVVVSNSSNDAYNIAMTPADQNVGSGAITTVTLAVTDAFGNPVTTTDDTGNVTITASGEVLLAGFQTSAAYKTGTDGTVTVTVIAGNSAGTGTLAAVPTTGDAAYAWQTGFTAPTGAPAPVTSAAATVQVSGSPTAQAITITGERGTVRGKPGIIVDGVTEGFGQGAILRPWVKFPGQTSYTIGSKLILVDQDGEFMWQRRTGKKTYVIIKSEDESVRSNRIIIPAK